MEVKLLASEELDKLSGVPTAAGVVTRWDTEVSPPKYLSSHLVFSAGTTPMDLAHEIGHIRGGHHREHPTTKTLGELFWEEIGASRFAAERAGRSPRIKEACNAASEVLSRVTDVTKAEIDFLAEKACYELFGPSYSSSRLRSVKEELYYRWRHKSF